MGINRYIYRTRLACFSYKYKLKTFEHDIKRKSLATSWKIKQISVIWYHSFILSSFHFIWFVFKIKTMTTTTTTTFNILKLMKFQGTHRAWKQKERKLKQYVTNMKTLFARWTITSIRSGSVNILGCCWYSAI